MELLHRSSVESGPHVAVIFVLPISRIPIK
jgi:hypothetical protein